MLEQLFRRLYGDEVDNIPLFIRMASEMPNHSKETDQLSKYSTSKGHQTKFYQLESAYRPISKTIPPKDFLKHE